MNAMPRQVQPTGDASWEYRAIALQPGDESQLNRLGAEGWELVAVVPDGKAAVTACYLKRPVLSFKERVTLEQKHRYYRQWGHDVPEDERDGRAMN